MIKHQDVFSYITTEEANYALPVNVFGWDWSMQEHVKTSFYYKNGRLLTGNQPDKPVKNIVKPLLNLQYRAEDIDVKNITLFIDNPKQYHLSFLVKKYHDDVFLLENDLDEFIDECKEEHIDYGAVIVEDTGKPKPAINHLQTIAFCDQTDILGAPICFKHYFTAGQLKDMESKGWGKEENGATLTIQELIILAESQDKGGKDYDKKGKLNLPGKYIEIYRLHGSMPNDWLEDGGDPDEYSYQMQVVAFYKDEKGEKQGVCLYRKKDKPERFKVFKRDDVYGRACGYGGVEELFESQVWTNYGEIRKKQLLDAASKILFQTDDEGLAARHPSGLKNVDNLEIIEVGEGKNISQIDTFPRNINLFDKSIEDWMAHGQMTSSANDAILGNSPNSGTPFKLQELVTNEAHGIHDYRRGKYAKFLEIVYRDFIIPHIVKKITDGQTFLSSLTSDEMQIVGENVINNELIKQEIEIILKGGMVTPEDRELRKNSLREAFMKDNNKFIEILKGELKDVALRIKINIANKQTDLSSRVDKLVNIFRQIISSTNPQTGASVLDDPKMAKIFNTILESSGLSPIDFSMPARPQIEQMAPQLAQPQSPSQNINQLI
jgi:hypothetical protein